jgi:hypothetical protein
VPGLRTVAADTFAFGTTFQLGLHRNVTYRKGNTWKMIPDVRGKIDAPVNLGSATSIPPLFTARGFFYSLRLPYGFITI